MPRPATGATPKRAGPPGEAPTLVFLHYFAGSARAWSGVIARLEPRFRCIAPNLAGFGGAAAPGPGRELAAYACDVAELARGPYTLVGHSMGAKIAMELAAGRPAGLRSLVLIAPSPPTPEPMSESERGRLLCSHGDRRAAEALARKLTVRPLPADRLAEVVADCLSTSPQAWSWWVERGSREDISGRLTGVDYPALVVVGASDPVMPLSTQFVTARCFAGSNLIVVPDAGHLVPIEAAQRTAELIPEFMANDLHVGRPTLERAGLFSAAEQWIV